MNFHVGQKVVCIDDRQRNLPTNCVRGVVYTISDIYVHPQWGMKVYLHEIQAPPFNQGYFADRFRPVRTTDISIFTAMLAPISHKELAPQD